MGRDHEHTFLTCEWWICLFSTLKTLNNCFCLFYVQPPATYFQTPCRKSKSLSSPPTSAMIKWQQYPGPIVMIPK